MRTAVHIEVDMVQRRTAVIEGIEKILKFEERNEESIKKIKRREINQR